MTYTVLFIPAELWTPATLVEVGENQLEKLQSLVGGFIEAISVAPMTLFCNEDGKSLGLDTNMRASVFLREKGVDLFEAGDVLCGPVVVAGFDESGETVSVSDEDVAVFTELFGETPPLA